LVWTHIPQKTQPISSSDIIKKQYYVKLNQFVAAFEELDCVNLAGVRKGSVSFWA